MDLFSGCGGISYGLAVAAARLGGALQLDLALDTDSTALATLAANIPGATTVCGTVESHFDGRCGAPLTRSEQQCRHAIGSPDLLVGGPPCQGYSDLNNKTRRNDPRNELYLAMARAAEVLQPRFVLIENVTGARLDPSGVVARTCQTLARNGYVVHPQAVDMAQLGVPQTRRRFVVVAARGDEAELLEAVAELHGSCSAHQARPVGWAVDDLLGREGSSDFDRTSQMSPLNQMRVAWLFDHDAFELPNYLRPPCHQGEHRYPSMYGRLRWDRPAQTITTGYGSMGQGRFIHPLEPRNLTPHEAARLQTFPDSFLFPPATRGEWAKMIGNAVPPLVNVVIGMRLIPALTYTNESRSASL